MKTYKSTTSERQLFIYQQLTAGRHIQKSQLAKQFAVDARTIQRDLRVSIILCTFENPSLYEMLT